MEDFVEYLFHVARPKFAEGGVERGTASQGGMRRDHESARIGAIAPYEFGPGHDAGDSLGPFAFGHAQPITAALEGSFRDDTIHQLALFGAVFKDPAGGLTECGFGKALRYSVAQGSDGGQTAAEDGWSAHDFGDAGGGDHLVSV
jgi:hypothetical protein